MHSAVSPYIDSVRLRVTLPKVPLLYLFEYYLLYSVNINFLQNCEAESARNINVLSLHKSFRNHLEKLKPFFDKTKVCFFTLDACKPVLGDS